MHQKLVAVLNIKKLSGRLATPVPEFSRKKMSRTAAALKVSNIEHPISDRVLCYLDDNRQSVDRVTRMLKCGLSERARLSQPLNCPLGTVLARGRIGIGIPQTQRLRPVAKRLCAMTNRRRHFKQETTLQDRIVEWARSVRAQAAQLPRSRAR
jgi:hypothetical protein